MEANTLGYVHELKFRELTAKGENESIKTNVYSVIKLTKTVSEFCHKLAGIKEQTAVSLNALVETFRRKTIEIRKRPECQSKTFLDAWDAILGEVENEAKDLTELGQQLQRSVACPLLRTAERKKHFCKKSFAYRESYQIQISKSEDELNKRHKDYSDAWYKFNTHEKENLKDHHIAVYHNEHNSFLLQLANVNSMNETHYKHTVPDILDDVETIHKDMNDSLLKYLKQFLGIQKDTLNKLITRMDNAVEVAKKIDVDADITNFVKFANHSLHDREIPFRQFFKPKATKEFKDQETKQLTYLDKAIIVDQFTEPMLKRTVAYSRKRIAELDASMRTLQSQINTSKELLQRDKESNDNQEPSVDEIEVLHKTNDFRDQRSLQNTLYAQMTLFTDEILEQLGPISDDYANDIGKQKTITIGRPNDKTI
ncbi:SH3 and F-BAR domain-containing protein DDB_G0274695-like [Rhopilema esculentum]|uniref:SH3 and F-BAR domain-containing protein DDB_G0274695-like n=1 Tax=Rhopilema esculentum TaxID=499914 RepID=UPI0031D5EB0A